MKSEHLKVFTDISILVNRLHDLLKDQGIDSIIKDNAESARLGGFGSFQNTVELYILATDVEAATPIIEKFKKEISE